jgi:hypothetical protein
LVDPSTNAEPEAHEHFIGRAGLGEVAATPAIAERFPLRAVTHGKPSGAALVDDSIAIVVFAVALFDGWHTHRHWRGAA